MTKQTLLYLKTRASRHVTESITHVSCKDIRQLLDERERLKQALKQSLAVFGGPKIDPLKAFVCVEQMKHTLESVNAKVEERGQ